MMTNTDMAQDNAATQTSDRSIAIRQAAQILTGDRGLKLTNYEEMYRFAKAVAESKFKPVADWNVVDCFICLQKGAEVGMTPMQALESIYVVNNRATLFGDAPKGLVEASGLMIDYDQYEEGKPFEDDYKYVVTSHRKGRSKPLITTYSVADAKLAKLWGKTGAWSSAPKRMLMFRARGFNLRDNFSDVLKGFTIGELIDDESVAGFEHAKAVTAKIVEPNFGPQQTADILKTTQTSETSDSVPRETLAPKRPRGRPPKNPQVQPVEVPESSESEPEKDKPKEESNEPEPEPAALQTNPGASQPETQPANVQVGRQTSLFSVSGSIAETPRAEVERRLREAQIPQEKFLQLLNAFGYLDCDLGEITMGHITLKNVEDKDLELTLKNWPTVLKNLGAS